jgi:uncharacterized RDD family membrane protein YckC
MTTRCIRCGNIVQGMSQFCDDCAAQQAEAAGFPQATQPAQTSGAQQAATAPAAATNCPSCGNELPAGAAFCGVCGAHVPGVTPGTCANCGAALTPGTQFCANCGASVAVGPAYGGFWARFLAQIIDSIILFFIAGIAAVVLALVVGEPAVAYLLYIPIAIAYYSWGNGSGGTWGKQAMGLRVVSPHGGDIGIGAGLGRTIVWWLGSIPFYLGWFWMLWDREKRCWHDHAAGSIVVKANR